MTAYNCALLIIGNALVYRNVYGIVLYLYFIVQENVS